MTSYDAGTARAVYSVSFDRFRQEAAEIRRIWQGIADAGAQTQRGLGASGGARGGGGGGGRGTNTAAQAARAEREALALARAQATAAKEAGNQAEAIRVLERALAGANPNTTAYINTQRQLARAQREVAQGAAGAAKNLQVLPRTIAGLSGEAATFAQNLGQIGGGLGVAFGVQQIAAFTGQAIQSANALEDVQQSLRVVAQDQETYNKAIKAAQDAQRLFGGSLAENIGDLQGFVLTSRTAGVELDDLVLVSRQLALLDPGQGLRGASIALREFLSGNITSLAQRFELPRTVLRTLGDETATTADKLDALSSFLSDAGVSAQAIEGRLENTSQAYRDLGVAGSEAFNRLGKAAAENGKGVAEFLTEGLEGLSLILNIGERTKEAAAQILASSDTYDVYRARVEAANERLSQLGSSINLLTPAAFASQKAFEASGGAALSASVSAEKFAATANVVAFTQELIATRLRLGYDASKLNEQGQADLGAEMLRLAGTSESNRLTIEGLAQGYFDGKINADQLASSVAAVATANEAARIATQENADAVAAVAAVLDTSKLAAEGQKDALQDAAQAAYEQANAGGTLEAQARAAAAALIDAGVAGELAARQLANSSADVDKLTLAYFNLERARGRGQDGGLLGGPNEAPGLTRAQKERLAAEESARYQRQLQDDLTRATGSTADQLALVNRELAKAPPLSERRKELLIEQARLQQQIAREREQTGARAEKAATKQANTEQREAERAAEAAAREAERREEEIARAYERIEDLDKAHRERLRRQAEDYAVDATRAEEDYRKERQRLLAEGRVFEAQQLKEEFEQEQRRNREDRDRENLRTREDFAGDVAEVAEEAELSGVLPAGVPPGLVPATLPPGVLPTAGGAAAAAAQAAQAPALNGRLLIEFAPITFNADGETLARIVYAPIETSIAEAFALGRIRAEQGTGPGQAIGVGGARP